MADIKAKKVLFKNRDGEHLIPYVGDSVIENRITNCLLEVPQRIKLELVDGKCVLKAGSIVTFPDGLNSDGSFKFIEREITSDVSLNYATASGDFFLQVYNSTNITYRHSYVGTTISGATSQTLSSNTYVWYDTANNLMKVTSDKGVTWATQRLSLPLGIEVSDGTKATNINQVFNGFGYIGSTAWADKGIKFLSANGRNADGTLKNLELETQKLMVRTNPLGANLGWWRLNNYEFIDMSKTRQNYFEQEEEPVGATHTVWYKPSENITRIVRGTAGQWEKFNGFYVASSSADSNGKITSFNPKQPFRAVDWYDFKANINDLEIDIDATVPAGTVISSAKSSTPAGYLYCNGSAVSRTTYAKLFSAIGTTYGTGDGSTTFNLPNFTTYKFVTSTSVSVKGTGKSLGLTNGSINLSPMTFSDKGYGLLTGTDIFNTTVGTVGASAGGTSYASVGVVTDASKSGITGTVSTATIKWYIKY